MMMSSVCRMTNVNGKLYIYGSLMSLSRSG